MTRIERGGPLGPGRCPTCEGRIVWALNDHDSRVPINAQAHIEGNQVLWHDDPPDEVDQRVSGVAAFELATGQPYRGPTYLSHFVTCSGAYPMVPSNARQLSLIPGGKR